jgi:DNA-binding NtrC family response regulator
MSYRLATADSPTEPILDPDPGAAFRSIVGQSPAIRKAVGMAVRAAARPASTVLLVGATGTGKELFARAIHAASPALEASSEEAPFVPIDCSAVPTALLESELFGKERSAFAFEGQGKQGLLELARTGTLLLDEVGELPQDLQPKLLKALEERRTRRVGGYDETEVRCRVIAATSRPLEEAVAEGRFRTDLLHRLNLLRVWVPPLGEREGDIALLARHFLEELAEDRGLSPVRLSPEALRVLEDHPWPGNVRELRNVLHRAALRCDDETILPPDLSIGQRTSPRSGRHADAAGFIPIPADGRSLASVEAEAVRMTLEVTDWNQSAAARILGVSRPTLARKIERYGLSPEQGPGGVR